MRATGIRSCSFVALLLAASPLLQAASPVAQSAGGHVDKVIGMLVDSDGTEEIIVRSSLRVINR